MSLSTFSLVRTQEEKILFKKLSLWRVLLLTDMSRDKS